MDAAARYASNFLGTTKDNPTVAALVVDPTNNTLLARAVTATGGRPHAETRAIAEAGPKTDGATLYVTLEPCNHQGKTPPCVDAAIAAKFKRVVVGQLDVDPRTAGKSIEKMRNHGINVDVVDRHQTTAQLHRAFFHRMSTGRPYVIAKLAVSADGMVGRVGEGNVPITGADAKNWTHSLRARVDGIAVGAKTFQLDQPALNVRLRGLEDRSPERFVFSTSERAHANATTIDSGQGLSQALKTVGEAGINSLLIEGGPALLQSLLDEALINEFHLLKSKKLIGTKGQPAFEGAYATQVLLALGFELREQRQLGNDQLFSFTKDR